jgi:hypothetical protein
VNAVMHPAQMVCNASWIEASGGDFLVYREGSGPGTSKVIEAVDAERVALAGALGVPTLSLVDALASAGYTVEVPVVERRRRLYPADWLACLKRIWRLPVRAASGD